MNITRSRTASLCPPACTWPYFGPEEISAVTRVLRSGKVNQWTGTEVFDFEREFAGYVGAKYAVAVVNGSVALDMALEVLGIGPGDEVIVPSRTFVASASCVALKNAIPVFCDVDRNSQDLTIETITRVLTPRTKAIIAVHIAGWPCDLEELRAFCDSKGLYLIEDCAQAHGSRYRGKSSGSFGDISCFSFCQDKIITTGGEGGMLVTNNGRYWQKAWSLKDHGRDHGRAFKKKANGNSFAWMVKDFGTNYRMTEMQAAIGRVMLKKLDRWVRERRRLAGIFTEQFSAVPALRVCVPPGDVFHSYYKYYAFLRPERLKPGWSRDRILNILHARKVPCGSGICPEVYREEAFKKILHSQRARSVKFLNARELGLTSLMFFVHPTLSPAHVKYVAEEAASLLARAAK
jgi:dTDP-4-amino-4,6-dideoxygalactose transaminase